MGLYVNIFISIIFIIACMIMFKNYYVERKNQHQVALWVKNKYQEFSQKFGNIRNDKMKGQLDNKLEDMIKEIVALHFTEKETKSTENMKVIFRKLNQVMYIDLMALYYVRTEILNEGKYTEKEIDSFKSKKYFNKVKYMLDSEKIDIGIAKYETYLELESKGKKNEARNDLKVYAQLIKNKIEKQKRMIKERY